MDLSTAYTTLGLLNVDAYEITDSNEVKKCTTIQLAAFNGLTGAVEKVGILQLNDKNYLYHHEYEIGIMANGWRGYYTLYAMESRDLQKAYVLGNSCVGSAEECFCVEKYSDNKKFETVCYANALVPQRVDYFGYSDEADEGRWRWSDGVSYYENWTNYGEWDLPDNGESFGGNEDYAEFNYERGKDGLPNDGTWNDAAFRENTDTFLCEWDFGLMSRYSAN